MYRQACHNHPHVPQLLPVVCLPNRLRELRLKPPFVKQLVPKLTSASVVSLINLGNAKVVLLVERELGVFGLPLSLSQRRGDVYKKKR